MRVLGVDYGDKYVGLALSDPTGLIASPHSTLYRQEPANLKATVRAIRALCEQEEVHTIVLGLPLNMDDTEGPRCEKSRAFKKRLERDLYQVEVVLWDERLSTCEAEEPLFEMGLNRKARKEVVDKIAAALILQSYLDAQRNAASAGEKSACEDKSEIQPKQTEN